MDHSMDSFIRQFKADGRSNNFEASIKNISLNQSDTGIKQPKTEEYSETPSAGDISE